jgi:hypothetical protein
MILPALKIKLHEHCIALLEERIAGAEKAMHQAQESANSEDKSSAGDKYETGRAMSQIARDMNAKQLKTAQDDLKELKKCNPAKTINIAGKGALIFSDNGPLIYVASGIGLIGFDAYKIAVISAQSPLAAELMNKKPGDTFQMQQQVFRIMNIV